MKIYWSDREGNPAPAEARFYAYPFSSTRISSTQTQVKELPPPIHLNGVKQTFLPNKQDWIQKVEKALHLIEEGLLQKVVLARACILELESEPDPFAIAAALKEKAQNAHVFCLATDSEAFLGATPERLFQRRGSQITSEAIAGTRKRGATPAEDEKLKQELLMSPKDLREFSLVKEYIQEVLSPYTFNLSFSEPKVRQTHNVQHLYSLCSGTLINPLAEAQLIPLIHPTPALCGTPKKKALSMIRELEPFDRALYGGAVGWTTPDASDWIVAIRSCRVEKNIVTLYSGAGIVAGSDPEIEWEELNEKIKLYTELN